MKKAFFNLFFLSLGSGLFAQKIEPKMTCEVSQTEVLAGNYVRVEYKLRGAENGDWRLPDWGGFTVISGPSQSSNFSMMNGKTDRSTTLTYLIEPRDTGDWVIPKASFALENGDVLTAGEVPIRVFSNPDRIIEKPDTKPQDEATDPFGGGIFDLFGLPDPPEERLPEPSVKPIKKRKIYRI